MDGYFNVIQKRLDDLVKISITERKNNGPGVLFLNFCDLSKMDCAYIKINDPDFDPELRKQFINRFENSPNSIIYFYVFDNKDSQILEIDLDKNSNFHKIEKNK